MSARGTEGCLDGLSSPFLGVMAGRGAWRGCWRLEDASVNERKRDESRIGSDLMVCYALAILMLECMGSAYDDMFVI
jgi:hypothetical protein